MKNFLIVFLTHFFFLLVQSALMEKVQMEMARYMVVRTMVKKLVMARLMVTQWCESGRDRRIRPMWKEIFMNARGTLYFALGAPAACADEVVRHHIEPTHMKARLCQSFLGITDSLDPNSIEAMKIAKLLLLDKARSYA